MADDKAQTSKSQGQSPLAAILGLVLPALLAGGAAFGGARLAAGGAHAPKTVFVEKSAGPPGPTLTLEPFIFTVSDSTHKTHAVKVSIAVEFKAVKGKEEDFKNLIPRVRDAALTYFRTITYEAATTQGLDEKGREELLARIRQNGGGEAEKVLVTDFVVQ